MKSFKSTAWLLPQEFPMTLECQVKQKIDESETGYLTLFIIPTSSLVRLLVMPSQTGNN